MIRIMSEIELVEKLAHTLFERMRPSIPLAVDLWDIATVAQYLKPDTVRVGAAHCCATSPYKPSEPLSRHSA